MASDNLDLEDLLNEDFSSGPSTKTGETPSELVQVYEQDALNVLVADPEDSWGRRLENLLRRWFGE